MTDPDPLAKLVTGELIRPMTDAEIRYTCERLARYQDLRPRRPPTIDANEIDIDADDLARHRKLVAAAIAIDRQNRDGTRPQPPDERRHSRRLAASLRHAEQQ